MGDCKYCAKPAGFLRSSHSNCKVANEKALSAIIDAARFALKGSSALDPLRSSILSIAHQSKVSDLDMRDALATVWSQTVEDYLQDGLIEPDEEQRLSAFQQLFSLQQQDLDKNGAYIRVAKAGVLRSLMQGQLPARVAVAGGLPINLQKGESIIWAFRDVQMLEDKTRREYVGRSQGMSFRIMKGVYYRVGGFKGTPVEKTQRVGVDTGMMVVTDKNIYFAGPIKSIRIPFAKIVAFHPYDDGVGVMKDVANAKAQVFITNDGWFTYNLLTNICNVQ
jgi:hypothetical protein